MHSVIVEFQYGEEFDPEQIAGIAHVATVATLDVRSSCGACPAAPGMA